MSKIFREIKQNMYIGIPFFLVYLLLGILVIYKSNFDYIKDDLYFSFDPLYYLMYYFNPDNKLIYDIRHPLMEIFFKPLMYVLTFMFKPYSIEVATIAYLLIGTVLNTMSVILFYSIIKKFIHEKFICIILTSMFGFSASNLMICFTPESYAISQLLLLFVAHISWTMLVEKQNINIIFNYILGFVITGITITNGAIWAMANLLNMKFKIKPILLSIFMVISLFFTVLTLWTLLTHNPINGFMDSIHEKTLFIDMDRCQGELKVENKALVIINTFFIAPLIFCKLKITSYGAIELIGSNSILSYTIATIFYIFLLYSIFKSRKNKFMLWLFMSYVTNFILHVVVGFGFYEIFLYAGHFTFIAPLILAVGYSYCENKHIKRYFQIFVASFLICMLIINSYKIYLFVNFLHQYLH